MTISVILGHPYPHSFNAALAKAACETLESDGHTVRFHDLHAEEFDPVMPGGELVDDAGADPLVQLHQKEIRQADGIIVIHPNWWGQPPAIMKGWIDRVLRENVAYKFAAGDSGGGVPEGLLGAKAGIVLNTSNTGEDRENTVFGDPLEQIWKDCIFGFCGVRTCHRRVFRIMADSTPGQRECWLHDVRELVHEVFSA